MGQRLEEHLVMAPLAAEPAYFGASASSSGPRLPALMGWLHRTAAMQTPALGLVLCSPFGFEASCAHRSLRALADAAAQAGIPTMRFDYAQCGQSEGEDGAHDAWPLWLASVHAAIDALQRSTGVRSVCLLGVRQGAALAALAASARRDVAALVAVAPVVRGRAYLRELRVLSQTGAARQDGPNASTLPEGALESAGYVMNAATVATVSQVDLRTMTQAPAPRVLLVPRDDLPEPPDMHEWQSALREQGLNVAVGAWPGYAGMMDDPQRVQVPRILIDGVLAWLRPVARFAEAAMAPSLVTAVTASRASWGESSITFDHAGARITERMAPIALADSRLFAVLTQPCVPVPDAPTIVLLNSGSIHTVGPNRLWVRLARRWAARGATVLRLDISGIGDSQPRPGAAENVVYSPHALADIDATVTWLRRTVGARDVHLLGLCSGAYHAFKMASAGSAIASATMINPLTYFWDEGETLGDVKDYEVVALASKFRVKLLTAEPWRKLWRGQLDVRLVLQVLRRRVWNWMAPSLHELAGALRWPLQRDLARELDAAAAQGVALRFVFAERAPGHVLLRNQSGHAMTRLQARGAASVDVIAGADHTFTSFGPRERLVGLLDELMLGARRATRAGD